MKIKAGKILLLVLLLPLPLSALAKTSFKLSSGASVHVLSDKAFRRLNKDTFEAVGNVIITYKDSAIYGEKTTVDFEKTEIRVIGNVRYVGPEVTFYGSEIIYNLDKNTFSLINARAISDNYVISGKEITRIGDNVIVGVDTEYTTCQDCPESWSVTGSRLHITKGEYVRIWHAYIKVKGVVVLYIPYIILPIKKKRETGLLFPYLRFDFEEGAYLGQPFFWAINDHSDLTVTPSIFGDRGIANELEFRHVLGEKKWYRINSLQAQDEIYLPYKSNKEDSGKKTFRHVSTYEHHYTDGRYFNHHMYYNVAKDLDVVRDFDFYTGKEILGSELGGNAFFETRNTIFNLNLEGNFNRNILYLESTGFDHRYVQILPELSFYTIPLQIFKNRSWGSLTLGINSEFTRFKQNHVEEENFIRNAIRVNTRPYLDWNWGNFGSVSVSTRATFDQQKYRFPHLSSDKTFSKSNMIYKTQASLRMARTFGTTVRKQVDEESKKEGSKKKKSKIIGKLPPIKNQRKKERKYIVKNSYRHIQHFALNHHMLGDQRISGSSRWRNQIASDSGQFDEIDALREKQHNIETASSSTSLPLSNTIEFQWNNSLVEKTFRNKGSPPEQNESKVNLLSKFKYRKMAYFNVSQGYNLDIKEGNLKDKLTRLYMTVGWNSDKGSISANEYYFYDSKKHVFQFQAKRYFRLGHFGLSFNYDPFTFPRDKRTEIEGLVKLSDRVSLSTVYNYDIARHRSDRLKYKLGFSPYSNCWKVDLVYDKDITDKKISLTFSINFNRNSFTSLQRS